MGLNWKCVGDSRLDCFGDESGSAGGTGLQMCWCTAGWIVLEMLGGIAGGTWLKLFGGTTGGSVLEMRGESRWVCFGDVLLKQLGLG